MFSLSTLPRAARLSRARWVCSAAQQSHPPSAARKRARERRQDAAKARVAAHLELKAEIDARRRAIDQDHLLTMFISVPPFVRERCGLTDKLARVKAVFDRRELNNEQAVRTKIAGVLTRIFPELTSNELIRDANDFDLKAHGHPFDLSRLSSDDQLFLEVIPSSLPPPRVERSKRWYTVRATAADPPNTLLRMVSFYKFYHIEDPVGTAARLKKVWGIMGALGRVYVATEGINAQMAIPEATWKDFCDAMRGEWKERDDYLVPEQLIGVYLNEDGTTERSEQPFNTLHVRPREKILADGLANSLDWSKAGQELPPEVWHDRLNETENPILVDCRNKYESDVGRFEGAETPNTKTFRETWDWLENRLQNVDKDAPIMTYCTGGIRCVKVNAYLEQKMGFTNTSRLGGGIVSYARTLEGKDKLSESKYKGNMHVFDGRIGRTVTDEVLTRCENCGTISDVQTDCAYIGCDRPFESRLFIQCPDCAAELRGACCKECYDAMVKSEGVLPGRKVDSADSLYAPHKSRVEVYSDEFSTAESPLLAELRRETERLFPGRSHMMSGPMQGAFLAMLISLTNCRRVLELGTFVGYSTLFMANALPKDGQLVTCEIDEEAAAVARKYFEGENRITLEMSAADKYLATVTEPFDMVFVDANKGGYEEYYETLLSRGLVKPGGTMVFDNVLFKGLVATSGMEDELRFEDVEKGMVRSRQRSIRKAHKIARKLHAFNLKVRDDERTEQVLLPARDGLLLVRRKG